MSWKAGSRHVNVVVIHASYLKSLCFDSRCWSVLRECMILLHSLCTDTYTNMTVELATDTLIHIFSHSKFRVIRLRKLIFCELCSSGIGSMKNRKELHREDMLSCRSDVIY